MIAHVALSPDEAALVMREAAIIAADRMLAEALLSREDAARMLGVSTAMLNSLPIKGVKIGACTRYRMQDLKTYAENQLE